MAKIENIIPQQNFERVRDAIGGILAIELKNQVDLINYVQPDPENPDAPLPPPVFPWEIGVFLERITGVEEGEDIVVNTRVFNGESDRNTPIDETVNGNFLIDVYVNGLHPGGGVDNDSVLRLHKIMGWIRYILSSGAYRFLGFPYGVIETKRVASYVIPQEPEREDSQYTVKGRIVFSCSFKECNELENSDFEVSEIFTEVKICKTDLGYKYEKISINE